MSLLAPLFLLAGLAVALPFWLHRLQVQSAERRPFSSTMLLESTDKQVHVQKKLRYRLLLALRATLLLLLALAFAKPVWTDRTPESLPVTATHLILIDASASMSRAGAADRARAAARAALDTVPDGALIQVLAADSRIHALSEPSAEKASQRAAIETFEAGTLRLDFGAAMAAVDRHAGDLPQPLELHLVSDFQESGMPVRFADLVARNLAALHPHPVAQPARYNWRVEYAAPDDAGIEVGVVAAQGEPRTADLRLSLNDAVVGRVVLGEAGRNSHVFDDTGLEQGDNRVVATIVSDDDLAIDNTWYQVIDNAPPEPVPLITANPDARAATYLEAALAADRASGYRTAIMRTGDADFRTLTRYDWALVDDLGAVTGGLDATLRSFVTGGGNLLAFTGRLPGLTETLPVSGHQVRPAAVGARNDAFLNIGQLDSGHPLLAGTAGWHVVNVTRNLVVDPRDGEQVLIRLEDGTPFLIESRIGAGRLLLLTSALDNEWSDLPTRPVFVSFIVEAARYLSGAERVRRAYTAGDVLALSLSDGVSGQVIDPDGRSVLSLADTTRAQQVRLDKPGFYEVYTPKRQFIVAVNPDPRESEPGMIPAATLERWRNAIAGQAQQATAVAVTRGAESPLELWHAALLLLVLLVIGESLLGNANFRPRVPA